MNLNFEYNDLFNEGHDLDDIREWKNNGFPVGLLLDDETYGEVAGLGSLLSETKIDWENEVLHDIRTGLIESFSSDAAHDLEWALAEAGIRKELPLHKQVRTLTAANSVARTMSECLFGHRAAAKILERETVTSSKGKVTRRVLVEIPSGQTAWVTDNRKSKKNK
jgi:hypothetical protein